MTLNPYINSGSFYGEENEQSLVQDLIIESIQMWGNEMLYLPRTLVSKDEILGEDRLSVFENAYPIEMYFESIDAFEGQGLFIQKFGLMVEQSATLMVAKKRWEDVVGAAGTSILPNRPAEGDLVYFPQSKGIFEIKFVQDKDPFYQIGKLFVYRLQVELFQYASEKINTGNEDVDVFESLKSFDTNPDVSDYGYIKSVSVVNGGSGYTVAPTVDFISTTGSGATATAVLGIGEDADKVVSVNVTNGGDGYSSDAAVVFTGANTTQAVATVVVDVNTDKVDSYGDNKKFNEESVNIVWNENNPFGNIE